MADPNLNAGWETEHIFSDLKSRQSAAHGYGTASYKYIGLIADIFVHNAAANPKIFIGLD
jgi:hypothetical protein